MNQGKTNIKYLSLVIVISILTGVIILGFQYWLLPKHEIELPEFKPPEKVTQNENSDGNEIAKSTYYVEDGKIYRINEYGDAELIYPDYYKVAKLSPNGKFLMLGGVGYDVVFVNIYDITSGVIYPTRESGAHFGEWLPDNRLRIVGGCGLGISCGIYESINNKEPWFLEKIEEFEGE